MRRAAFTQEDMARALRAARQNGYPVVELDPRSGRIIMRDAPALATDAGDAKDAGAVVNDRLKRMLANG